MTLLNKIKIYIMYSIGAILSLIGLYTLTSKRKNSQSIKKTDDAVIKNDHVIKDAEEQIKSVDVKKEQVLDLIGKQEEISFEESISKWKKWIDSTLIR